MKKTLGILLIAFAPACENSYGVHPEYAHAEHGEHAERAEHAGHHDDDGDGDHDDDDAVPNVSPEAAARVLVLQSANVDRATEVLGVIDVHTPSSDHDVALGLLRARAASMGAEAVLGVEFHHGDAPGPTHLSGMAVRFRDLLNGRHYDVIGHLDVHTPMGHDHDAMGHLYEQARALHADLIININYQHGDDPHGPTDLVGDAIRFR